MLGCFSMRRIFTSRSVVLRTMSSSAASGAQRAAALITVSAKCRGPAAARCEARAPTLALFELLDRHELARLLHTTTTRAARSPVAPQQASSVSSSGWRVSRRPTTAPQYPWSLAAHLVAALEHHAVGALAHDGDDLVLVHPAAGSEVRAVRRRPCGARPHTRTPPSQYAHGATRSPPRVVHRAPTVGIHV